MSNIQAELEYLMNSDLYAKYKEKHKVEEECLFETDKIFYKKRIIQLTKDLFKEEQHPESVNHFFKNYVKNCIRYFKMVDKRDILQVEYDGVNEKSSNSQYDISMSEVNNEFLKSGHFKTKTTLDNYVVKKVSKPKKEKSPPIKKIVNLKNPELMSKGVKKKQKKKKKKKEISNNSNDENKKTSS